MFGMVFVVKNMFFSFISMKKRSLLWSCLVFFAVACHNDGHDILNGSGEETAQVTLALRNNMQMHEMVLTRAARRPEEGDFLVRLENTRAEVLKEWRYDTLPSVIRVMPGSYKLVAYYGDRDNLPMFDTPFYYGETKASLKRGDNLDTVVHTSVATVKVGLTFDESFDFDYDDYFVEVKTVGDSLHFSRDEKREGYFLPGNLRMRFGLKPKGQEKYYEFYPEAIRNVKAAEFYRMTLKAQSENGVLSRISIITDTSTIHIPVNVELPSFMLPKAAPKVMLAGEDAAENVTITEGVGKNVMVSVMASGGLAELILKTTSDTLLARGWPVEIDLMKASAEEKARLKADGLMWSEIIDLSQGAVKSPVVVNFSGVAKSLCTAPGKTAVSAFEIVAKDQYGQVGNECKFTLEVAPPVFNFVTPPGGGNVWAKRVVYNVKYISEVREPVVEYQRDNGEWRTLETVLTNKAADEYECSARGLTPATRYAFRVRLGEHILDAGTYVTEGATQLPNAGMEEWYSEEGKTWTFLGKKGPYWYFWYPWNPDDILTQGWNTINLKTTNIDWKYQYNSISGTMRTDDKYSGNYAALIRTVGWGSGNTAAGSASTIQNIDPGYLYLGTYNSTTNTPEFGYSFVSRPAALQFYYKYSSNDDRFSAEIVVQNRDGNMITELGRGSFAGSDVGSYTPCKVLVDYDEAYVHLKATHMYISFKSGDKTDKNSLLELPPFGNLSDGKYVGSQLYIDDIELIYE